MNTNTHGRRTSTSVRRAVPAFAIVALAIGLGACQTPQGGAAVPAGTGDPARRGSGGRGPDPARRSDRRSSWSVKPSCLRPTSRAGPTTRHRAAGVRGIADREVDGPLPRHVGRSHRRADRTRAGRRQRPVQGQCPPTVSSTSSSARQPARAGSTEAATASTAEGACFPPETGPLRAVGRTRSSDADAPLR